jgi:hypothetical protein
MGAKQFKKIALGDKDAPNHIRRRNSVPAINKDPHTDSIAQYSTLCQ